MTTTERPPCENYARCTVTVVDDRPTTSAKRLLELTVEPGVEVRDGDDLDALWLVLHSFALHIGDVVLRRGWTEAMRLMHDDFEHVWPGRAWFVELHDSAGRWTQSYQPYGIPRRVTEEERERQADQVMRERARHPMLFGGKHEPAQVRTPHPIEDEIAKIMATTGIDRAGAVDALVAGKRIAFAARSFHRLDRDLAANGVTLGEGAAMETELADMLPIIPPLGTPAARFEQVVEAMQTGAISSEVGRELLTDPIWAPLTPDAVEHTVHGCGPAISLAQCARYPDCERCGPERR